MQKNQVYGEITQS